MKRTLLLFYWLLSFTLFAQGEADKWIMLNTSSGNGAQFLYDFTNDTNPMFAPQSFFLPGYYYEKGHSIVSNNQGELLFFSNGERVYNRQKNLMPNGQLLNGHMSSFQGTITVKHPAYDNQYHLFYTDAWEDSCENGLSYAIIDMCLDSGRGEVVVKDQQIFEGAAESVTAFQHANGEDFWIVAPKLISNEIWAFLLTENGIEDTVISTCDSTLYVINQIESSPDHRFLVTIDGYDVHVFHTNRSSGELIQDTTIAKTYGLCLNRFEISPSSNILYIGNCYGDTNSNSIFELSQYSLDSNNYLNSYLVDRDTGGVSVGLNLQNTPDGKMYIHPSGYVIAAGVPPGNHYGVIHEPDSFGPACHYSGEIWSGLTGLITYGNMQGWPNFPAWYFAPGFGGNIVSPYENPCAIIGCMDSSACTYDPLAEVHDSSMCVFIGASISSSGDSLFTQDSLHSLLWSTGDTLNYTQASSNGSYWLSITDTAGCSDTAWITVDWLSIEEQKQAFNIYPNPAQTTLFVNKKGVKNIYNLVGEKLLSSSKKRLNIQTLAAGVYLIECEGYYRKFVKE
jgi:hypothetical protein